MAARMEAAPAVRLIAIGLLGVALVACGGGGGKANQPPTAALTVTPASGPTPLVVTFNASGSTDREGQITSYAWSTGDGTSLSGVTATHTYPKPGTFTVTLTVTDHKGASATTSQVVTVENRPPVAAFVSDRPKGYVSVLLRFDASTSADPDGSVASYRWEFGDGATASGARAEHSYAAAGDHTVKLTVTDELGAATTAEQSMSVRPEREFPRYRVELLSLPSRDCDVTMINNAGQIVGSRPDAFGGTDGLWYSAGYMYWQGQYTNFIPANGVGDTYPFVLNEAGTVAGHVYDRSSQSWHIFKFDRGITERLPDPDGLRFDARTLISPSARLAINASGDIAATAWGRNTPEWASTGVLYQDGAWTEIPRDSQLSSAVDINDRGEVLGYDYVVNQPRPWVYRDGVVTLLQVPPENSVVPVAINNSGQVSANNLGVPERAYLYTDGAPRDLGSLGGVDAVGLSGAMAAALNEAGQVAGRSVAKDGFWYPFLFSEGHMQQLGWPIEPSELPQSSTATALNAHGDVTGMHANKAFVFRDGKTTDLDRLFALQTGWPGARWPADTIGCGINDLGEVVGLLRNFTRIPELAGVSRVFHALPIDLLLARLATSTTSVPAAAPLLPVLSSAEDAYAAMDLATTCTRLAQYDAGVRQLTPAAITQAQADALLGQSSEIAKAIECEA